MDIKFELLQSCLYKCIEKMFDDFEINSIVDSEAIKVLKEIKTVINKDELSDFDAVEEIVSILEYYKIDCGGRHDF